MKKNLKIILIIIGIIILLFIALFFVFHYLNPKKEIISNIPITTSSINNLQKINEFTGATLTTSTLDQLPLLSTIEFQTQINQEIDELIKNLKPDENKNITQYQKEIKELQQKIIQAFSNKQDLEMDPEIFLSVAKGLAKISPPPFIYKTHLELIKMFYTVGSALKEFQKTDDPFKKIMLYNLIKANLENIKF